MRRAGGLSWLLIGGFAACGPGATSPTEVHPGIVAWASSAKTVPSSRAITSRPLVSVYRDAASVFETFDNVSMWLPDKCDPEYRADWETRFGITDQDRLRFIEYKQIRKRYYPVRTEGPEDDPLLTDHGLFAPGKSPDRFAEAFYGSDSVDEALGKAASFMTAAEIDSLRTLYRTYRPRFDILFSEAAAYREAAAAVGRRLEDAHFAEFSRAMTTFYGVTEVPELTLVYVYWPKGSHITANTRGSYLLMKYSLPDQRDQLLRELEIPVHELGHVVSSHQPSLQKQRLTKTFLDGCKPPHPPGGPQLLEEPMAVVFQKLFLRSVDRSRFELATPWYGGDKWIDPFSKRIIGLVDESLSKGALFDEALALRLAGVCAVP